MRCIKPHEGSRCFLPVGHVQNTFKRRNPEGIIINHLCWLFFCHKGTYPILKAEPSHPTRELISAACIHNLILITVGESWNVDWLIYWEFFLHAQIILHHDGSLQRRRYCWRCPNPSAHLMLYLPITREQDPEIPKVLRLGQQISHNPEGAVHWFSTMASEAQTIILAALPLAENYPGVCWRSRPDEANRTMTSAKRRHATLSFPEGKFHPPLRKSSKRLFRDSTKSTIRLIRMHLFGCMNICAKLCTNELDMKISSKLSAGKAAQWI